MAEIKSGIKKYLAKNIDYTILVIVLLIIGLIEYIDYNKLENNIEYTKAVIIDDFSTVKATDYFGYEFYVKGVKYKGSGTYKPKKNKIRVGDSIKIVYDKTDPDNNRTLKYYKKSWFY